MKVALLPIIDQVPEKRRGIVRVFISNSSELPLDIQVLYTKTSWFSDLQRFEGLKLLESLKIYPKEVLVRDIVFKGDMKQGKNYFQIVVRKKKAKSKKEYLSAHFEYTQIREVTESNQVERSNFLGISSKAYVNPNALNYWIFYSLFGDKRYRKDNAFIIILKSLFLCSSIALLVLYFFIEIISNLDFLLPVSIILTILGFTSFFFNTSGKYMKLINELGLSTKKYKASIKFLAETSAETLQKFCLNDINFDYSSSKDKISWKESANKLYQKIIPEVNKILQLQTQIQPAKRSRKKVASEKHKEKRKKREHKGIEFTDDEGIEFQDNIKAVAHDAQGVKISNKGIVTKNVISDKMEKIETKKFIEQDIEPIVSNDLVSQKIEPIQISSSVEPKIHPIETEKRDLLSPEEVVSLTDIPAPKKIIQKEEKDTALSSVKEKKKTKSEE
ncbi:MAG: hypothetical protein ACTSP3_15380 [Candidatus Heimdallarchaeaceae archaeon]